MRGNRDASRSVFVAGDNGRKMWGRRLVGPVQQPRNAPTPTSSALNPVVAVIRDEVNLVPRAIFRSQREGREPILSGMNLAELESKVMQLSEEERREFAAWFYDHEDQIAGPAPAEDDDLSDGQKAELTRRLREIEQHPELLVPFAESDVKTMFAEFADARSKATSARQG